VGDAIGDPFSSLGALVKSTVGDAVDDSPAPAVSQQPR
jgi:hypothetical protein